MRLPLAWAAAAIGAVCLVAPARLAAEAYDETDVLTYSWVLYPVILAAVAIAAAFAHGVVSQRWAVAGIVLFFALGFLAGGAAYYAGYVAALLLGLAIAAGEPLPPPDPGDDRLHRPMPRGD